MNSFGYLLRSSVSCTAVMRFSPTVMHNYSLPGRAGQAGERELQEPHRSPGDTMKAPVKAGRESRMKEPHKKRVVNRLGPESCADVIPGHTVRISRIAVAPSGLVGGKGRALDMSSSFRRVDRPDGVGSCVRMRYGAGYAGRVSDPPKGGTPNRPVSELRPDG